MRIVVKFILLAAIAAFTGCADKGVVAAPKTAQINDRNISTYLQGEYVDVKTAESILKDAGFDVVATYEPVSKGMTIVFTDDVLKTQALKPGRSFVAVLRLFIDKKEKKISFTNPVYFGKAFMQEEYDSVLFNKELEKIKKAFPGLKDSADRLKFGDLGGYRFMIGMPYYNNPDILAKGDTLKLVKKANRYKKGKLKIFELKLSQKSYLFGYELGRRTKKFVKKIGRANAAVLPWCIAIENNKATALSAKYYIAISYPLLSMNDFMAIATIPGAVQKDLTKIFR